MEVALLTLVLLGLVAGLLAGLFGIGGGVLFTPILFFLFSDAGVADPVLWTIGTSLFCTFIASAGSSLRQYRQNNFFFGEGVRVGLFGSVGVFLGKQVVTSAFYTERAFALLFSLLFFYVAWSFFRRGRSANHTATDTPIGLREEALTGGAGGFVAALAGVGGGAVMVPVMNLWFRQRFRKVVSVSSLAIVLISLSGWLQLAFVDPSGLSLSGYSAGVVDFGTALPLSAGGLAGGFGGAFVNLKTDRRYLQFGFALLSIGVVVKLLSDVF